MKTNETLTKLPQAPAWLDAVGKSMWRKLGADLIETGILTRGDLRAFEMLCDAYSDVRALKKALDNEDVTIPGGRNGQYGRKINPIIAQLQKSRKAYTELAAHFGLTPMTRKNVKIEEPDGEFGLKVAK
jgi:P27 family predicted phage terminase small subunit